MESCEKSVVCALLAQLNKDGLLSKSACSKAEDLVHSWIDFPRFFQYPVALAKEDCSYECTQNP